jgi:thiol-disulfide isomerase/thioredoxin
MKPSLALTALAVLVSGCDRNSGSNDAAAIVTGTAASAASTAFADKAVDRSHDGEPLPAFVFSSPDGKRIDIAALKGKPVLINLWATWCGPCVAEMPTLDKLAADNSGTLRVVTIAEDGGAAPVVSFFQSYRFANLEPWLDPEGKIDYHYNTGKLPTTVYYDAHGREVWRYVGARDWGDTQTTALLLEGTIR